MPDPLQIVWKDKDGKVFEVLPLSAAVSAGLVSADTEAEATAARQLLVRRRSSASVGSTPLSSFKRLTLFSWQVEKLSDFDDAIGEAYLNASEAASDFGPAVAGLDPASVQAALRRVTIQHVGKAVVMLCGSAYKNKVCKKLECACNSSIST